jgi:NADPH-dependent F420 reductase
MTTNKTVAIIGATGDMGSAIAMSLVNSDYRLLLMSREKTKLAKLLSYIKKKNPATDVATIECEKEACWEADIIILTVPYRAEKEVAEKIREVATQKVVIEISNPLNETYDDLITAPNTSAAEELQKALPNSKVIKAFNTVFSSDFTQRIKDGKPIKTFIAGNDQEAVQTVVEMATAMGLRPIVYGGLSTARRIEPMIIQLIELKKEEHYNNFFDRIMHRYAPFRFKSVAR